MRVDDNTDLVSIVMPTFNSSRTIDRALDSILSQTHANWQLVCVDDASGDDTSERIVHRMQAWEDRVTVCRLPQNVGPARARNQGLAHCRGAWIAILDSDDAWRPERLRVMLDCAAATGADVVCDNLMGYDDHVGRETKPLFMNLPERLDIETAVAAEYQGYYNLGYLKPLMSRAFLHRHALAYDEALRTGEDLLLLLQILAEGGSVACLDAALYIYTTPVGDTSRKLSRSSATSPRDIELAAALRNFLDRYGEFDRRAQAAVTARIAYLNHVAVISAFRHARLNRDWARVFGLFVADPRVRHQVFSRIRLYSRSSKTAES